MTAEPADVVGAEAPLAPAAASISVVWIDHMRRRLRYEKALARLAAAHQVALVAVHAPESQQAARMASGGGGVESRGIYLFIRGDVEVQVSAFLQSFRSTKVDVDSAGRPCFERKSTILVSGRALGLGSVPRGSYEAITDLPGPGLAAAIALCGIDDVSILRTLGEVASVDLQCACSPESPDPSPLHALRRVVVFKFDHIKAKYARKVRSRSLRLSESPHAHFCACARGRH
jgi:hypothetical protein